MDGAIEIGSAVKTLNRGKAVYGRVTDWAKKRAGYRRAARVIVKGRTQPGAPTQTLEVHVEDLDLIPESELAPEDREPC